MDDMNAFERQVAREVAESVRPPRPVDANAIVRDATTQSSTWRLPSVLSAAKFVVAGAIVALFGGFLLAGVLTQPNRDAAPAASPSAEASMNADLLPGVELDTVAVGPGVFRVLGDGIHDLTNLRGVAVTPAGDVWVVGQRLLQTSAVTGNTYDNKIIRLGQPDVTLEGHDAPWRLTISPDGALVVTGIENPLFLAMSDEELARTYVNPLLREIEPPDAPIAEPDHRASVLRDGSWAPYRPTMCEWSAMELPGLFGGTTGDGCWAKNLMAPALLHFDDDQGFSAIDESHMVDAEDAGLEPDRMLESVAVANDGTVWASVHTPEMAAFEGLVSYDGETWTQHSYEDPRAGNEWPGRPLDLAVGPDGTVWVVRPGQDTGQTSSLIVTSWDGDRWTDFGPVEVDVNTGGHETHFLRDGTPWFLDGRFELANGVLRTLDLPIGSLVFGPHGTAWIMSDDEGEAGSRLFAITPETATAE